MNACDGAAKCTTQWREDTSARLFLPTQNPEIVLGVLIEILSLNSVSPRSGVARHGDVVLIPAARIAGRLPRVAVSGATLVRARWPRVSLPIEGALPSWLTGSLIRTGPAKFEVGEQSYQHWFDGLAMLHCFSLQNGGVTYSNRFLHSQSYREAMDSGRIARGEFMTDPCRTLFGRVMSFFNPKLTDNGCVNVSVLAGRDSRAHRNTTAGPFRSRHTRDAGNAALRQCHRRADFHGASALRRHARLFIRHRHGTQERLPHLRG